ncbi:MAB_1171c family putative transporter [Mycobacterium spongiae]|uniref:DUF6545 domain-containing protein n=1 Tax=Mycobacterium spongiae TaxID=886343 RepID=A0A975PXX7_9MYCO|nr:MAB_1171c family putative transporter [Mycobacterium spongiae]QUR68726.1 hypothetical protein F6B93_18085 [Mycobacterium spongiae]
MTTNVPAHLTWPPLTYLGWPLLVFMAAVVIVRYIFFNTSQYETFLNHSLAFILAGNLLSEGAVEDFLAYHQILTPTAAQQLAWTAMIFTTAEFMGFITLWSRSSPKETRRRHRYHRIAAIVLAAGFLIAATPARAAGQPLEAFGGWSTVLAWALLAGMLVALSIRLLRMSIKELTRPNAKRQERLIAAGGLAIGITVGTTGIDAVVLAACEELGWIHSIDYRLTVNGYSPFWESVATCLLASVPALLALLARTGLNSTSRHWRQLQPLRNSMADAVPESAFELKAPSSRRQKTLLDLHQTTIQIRDAILQLRAYFPDIDPAEANQCYQRYLAPTGQPEAAHHALQLAHAIHAKSSNVTPTPLDAAAIIKSRSTNLEQETAELLRLAKCWPHAQSAVEQARRRTLLPAFAD